MHKRLAFVAILGIAVILALPGQTADAQGASRQMPSLSLRGFVSVTIGMSEQSAREAITSAKAELRLIGEGSYLVGKQVGAEFVFSGDMVEFKDARLFLASAQWTPTRNRKTDRQVADALYGAFTSLSRTGKSCAVFTEDHASQPGLGLKEIIVECAAAGRSVRLTTSRGDQLMNGGTVIVTENIFEPRY